MSTTPFATISFDGEAVVLLDQRALPVEEAYVRCSTWQQVADGIRHMVVRGAPAIGITAAWGVYLGARDADAESWGALQTALEPVFAGLGATRPTAVNLFWALERMRSRLAGLGNLGRGDIVDALRVEAERIHEEDREMCAAMGRHGATLFTDQARVLTHCNTGALATGGTGTALAVIRAAWTQGRLSLVYADETRPFLQGARLTAWELHRDGIPTRVITDGMGAHFMKKGDIDAVIVGTDRIAGNGDVANKIGTYALAVACHHHGLPFYVAGPTSTIDLETLTGEEIEIEQRPAREVTHVGSVRIVPEGVLVLNPAFDVTPAALVTAIITEHGVISPPFGPALAAHVARARTP